MTTLAPAPDQSLLTPSEEVALARAVEAGLLARQLRLEGRGFGDASPDELADLEAAGEAARQRFIAANLGLVGMVARQFADRTRVSHAELYQEGCLGLITAVERWDWARGLRFSTYALFWVRACVGAAATGPLGPLQVPSSRAEQVREAHSREAELTQRLGRTPTRRELARALGRSVAWTAGLLAHETPQPLDLVDPQDLAGLVGGDPAGERSRGREVTDLLLGLDDLARSVLVLRLGLQDGQPRTLAGTSRALGLTPSHVRRVEARALDDLRAVCPQQARALL
ncbi:MAG: polymerase sigma factor [Friedmanniella sp.]|nr:polymerase sigma factor [Friedmanniella sp.]